MAAIGRSIHKGWAPAKFNNFFLVTYTKVLKYQCYWPWFATRERTFSLSQLWQLRNTNTWGPSMWQNGFFYKEYLKFKKLPYEWKRTDMGPFCFTYPCHFDIANSSLSHVLPVVHCNAPLLHRSRCKWRWIGLDLFNDDTHTSGHISHTFTSRVFS